MSNYLLLKLPLGRVHLDEWDVHMQPLQRRRTLTAAVGRQRVVVARAPPKITTGVDKQGPLSKLMAMLGLTPHQRLQQSFRHHHDRHQQQQQRQQQEQLRHCSHFHCPVTIAPLRTKPNGPRDSSGIAVARNSNDDRTTVTTNNNKRTAINNKTEMIWSRYGGRKILLKAAPHPSLDEPSPEGDTPQWLAKTKVRVLKRLKPVPDRPNYVEKALDRSATHAALCSSLPEQATAPKTVLTVVPRTTPAKAPTTNPAKAPVKAPSTTPAKAPAKAPTTRPATTPVKAPTKTPMTTPSKVPASAMPKHCDHVRGRAADKALTLQLARTFVPARVTATGEDCSDALCVLNEIGFGDPTQMTSEGASQHGVETPQSGTGGTTSRTNILTTRFGSLDTQQLRNVRYNHSSFFYRRKRR